MQLIRGASYLFVWFPECLPVRSWVWGLRGSRLSRLSPPLYTDLLLTSSISRLKLTCYGHCCFSSQTGTHSIPWWTNGSPLGTGTCSWRPWAVCWWRDRGRERQSEASKSWDLVPGSLYGDRGCTISQWDSVCLCQRLKVWAQQCSSLEQWLFFSKICRVALNYVYHHISLFLILLKFDLVLAKYFKC